jgi:hypothetical protein
MHTLVVYSNELKPETKEVLDRYKAYFSKTFLFKGTIIDGLKEHQNSFMRQEAFIVIDDKCKYLTDIHWRNIIIQSGLKAPIIFTRKVVTEDTIIYKNKLADTLRGIFENQAFSVSVGVYILNPKIYKYLAVSETLDGAIKLLAAQRRTKRRGSRESSNILVYTLQEDPVCLLKTELKVL